MNITSLLSIMNKSSQINPRYKKQIKNLPITYKLLHHRLQLRKLTDISSSWDFENDDVYDHQR